MLKVLIFSALCSLCYENKNCACYPIKCVQLVVSFFGANWIVKSYFIDSFKNFELLNCIIRIFVVIIGSKLFFQDI